MSSKRTGSVSAEWWRTREAKPRSTLAGANPQADGFLEIGAKIAAAYSESVRAYDVAGGFPALHVEHPPIPVLLDPMGHAHAKYGVKDGCLYLIRPDFYVAFRGDAASAPELTNYLERTLQHA